MSTKVKDRPTRSYKTGPVTRALRYVALVGVLVLSAYVALTYDALPEQVPTHFNFTGEADAWGPKSTIWVLIAINIVMVAGIAGLSTRPRWFNYPSGVTEDNAQFMYREGERMLVWMNLAIWVLFTGAILSIYEIETPFVALGMIAILALMITGLIRIALAGDKKSQSTEAAAGAQDL